MNEPADESAPELIPGRADLSAAEQWGAPPLETSNLSPMGQVDQLGSGFQTALAAGAWRRRSVKAFAWAMIVFFFAVLAIAVLV